MLVPAGEGGKRFSPRHKGRGIEEYLPQSSHRTQRNRFKMRYLERFVGFGRGTPTGQSTHSNKTGLHGGTE